MDLSKVKQGTVSNKSILNTWQGNCFFWGGQFFLSMKLSYNFSCLCHEGIRRSGGLLHLPLALSETELLILVGHKGIYTLETGKNKEFVPEYREDLP